MANLTQIELQNLRHLIGAHETNYQKLNTYASQAVDPQIKQIFTKSAQDALNTKQKLMSFLNIYVMEDTKMDEKTMVHDILEGVKSGLKTYQGVISEAENMQLRQTIQQIRNNDESFQYELFKVAQTKGYYKPAQSATPTEILTVKNELQ